MIEDHGKTSAGSSRLDPVTGGVFREPEPLRAVTEERPAALGSEEGGSDVEYGQVGDEVDRRLPLFTREHPDAREEILIREAGRERERVRIHASVYHDEFRALPKALVGARDVAARSVRRTRICRRGNGLEGRGRVSEVFIEKIARRSASRARKPGSESPDGQKKTPAVPSGNRRHAKATHSVNR